jgi:hypothetical protein
MCDDGFYEPFFEDKGLKRFREVLGRLRRKLSRSRWVYCRSEFVKLAFKLQ